MKAFTVRPGQPSGHGIRDVPKPARAKGEALVEVIEVGTDGTDRELIEGKYGEAPPGENHLIIGHESLGRVVKVEPGTSVAEDDLVVAIVRRPDPEPCKNCAAGEWDMCSNGRYTERGIKGAHGFLAEYYAESPTYLVRLPPGFRSFGVLLEPLSIVEKAVEQIGRIQDRLVWQPKRAMVVGAGTIGTLAVLLLRLEGLDVYLYSRGGGGRAREIAEQAGARYLDSSDWKLDHDLPKTTGQIDVIIEATGYSPLAFGAIDAIGPNGVVCLTGVSGESRKHTIDSSHLNLEMVLMNKVVFGSVNANRRHFDRGVTTMEAIEGRWPGLLDRFITKRVPLSEFTAEDIDSAGDLKVVVEVGP